jgi:hypothetical protein
MLDLRCLNARPARSKADFNSNRSSAVDRFGNRAVGMLVLHGLDLRDLPMDNRNFG